MIAGSALTMSYIVALALIALLFCGAADIQKAQTEDKPMTQNMTQNTRVERRKYPRIRTKEPVICVIWGDSIADTRGMVRDCSRSGLGIEVATAPGETRYKPGAMVLALVVSRGLDARLSMSGHISRKTSRGFAMQVTGCTDPSALQQWAIDGAITIK